MKRKRGVTLVEVVLATSIATVFISAFLLQFSIQQSSFQVASDEIRLPAAGSLAMTRVLSIEGLLPMYKPTLGAAFSEVSSSRVSLPTSIPTGSPYRLIQFTQAPGSLAGGIEVIDSAVMASSSLTPPTLIASMSFYCPEMVTITGGAFTADTTSAAYAVRIGPTVAFYILGAALRPGTDTAGAKTVLVTHTPTTDEWTFQFGGAVRRVNYATGATFTLDGAGSGSLVCAWPTVQAANPLASAPLNYTLSAPNNTLRRVGLWMRLNTSPYTGLIEIRDSLALRN